MSLRNKFLVIDFDGVVADTYRLHVDFLSNFYIPNSFTQKHLDKSCEINVHKKPSFWKNISDKIFYFLLEKYISRSDSEILFDKVIQAIRINKNPKVLMSLGSKKYIKTILGADTKEFSRIYGRFEIKTDKRLGYQEILLNYGLQSKDVVLFTDTVVDIFNFQEIAPDSEIYAVDWGYCPRSKLSKVLPYEQILDMKSFCEILTQI